MQAGRSALDLDITQGPAKFRVRGNADKATTYFTSEIRSHEWVHGGVGREQGERLSQITEERGNRLFLMRKRGQRSTASKLSRPECPPLGGKGGQAGSS